MRFIYSLALLILMAVQCYGQQIAVAAEKMDVFYIGVPNPIIPLVENMLCKDLLIETNNGTIIKSSEPCKYDVTPTKVGKTLIKIYRKADKELLGQKEFRTKRIPDPIAAIGSKSRGKITKALLKAQLGIALYMENFDFNAGFYVASYKVSIARNSSVIFEKNCTGARFDNDVTAALNTIKAGDIFSCTDIRFSGLGYNNEPTNSIELQVID